MTVTAGFRLSAQQERVWAQQIDTETPDWLEYHILLEGRLDLPRLHDSIRNVVSRHEILRTVFRRQPGFKSPLQIILEDSHFAWQTTDLSPIDSENQKIQIAAIVRAQRATATIESPPLLNILATLSSEKHLWVVSLPALCGDLQSLRNFTEEVGRSYAAIGERRVAADVFQYADVVEWQQELLTGEDTRGGRDFWRNQCRTLNFASSNSLLSTFGRKSESGFSPQFVPKQIDATLFHQIEEACSTHGASVSDCLLACWHIFFSRITGQPSILIGCAADGRAHQELEGAIGRFVKYLPIQFTTDFELPFSDSLKLTKTRLAECLSWQDSFWWTQVNVPADEKHTARIALAFDYGELDSKQFDGLKFTALREEGWSEFPTIRLSARRSSDLLLLEFRYDGALLDRETVERWSGHYLTLLAEAVAHPDTCAGRLSLLDSTELHRMVVEWNRTDAFYPPGRCIHELFEEQVLQTPSRIAVRFHATQLSYSELNEQANRLAHRLRFLGVGPNSLVALLMDRGVGMIVGLLGILKAGGAYVPLNVDNPKARLEQQLAGTAVLVTGKSETGNLPECGAPIVYLDMDTEDRAAGLSENPENHSRPDDLCYVIYTSGSTGVPKGVAVRHRNLVNYTRFITALLNLNSHPDGLHFATVSSLSADLGNTCIYPSLISGGCLHVIPIEVSREGESFREYADRNPIDVMKIVPSHLAALLDSAGHNQLLPRKFLITGGESLTAPLLEKVRSLSPHCEVVNHYGPTETTIGSLTMRLAKYRNDSGVGVIPIGRPIANTRTYILDARRELVPVGVAGELYIAGEGVTAGYLNQPDLTAERFFQECFTGDPASRMYRTGDLARYLPDGTIEFLGRTDDQVKIRGYRIELGEVESVLVRHDAVQQAIVTARADETGDRRLVAYVVLRDTTPAVTDSLRAWMREQLPEYMIPACIVFLARLPLTSNGKVDRQHLPNPADSQTQAGVYIAPRNAVETGIAEIWSDVLHLNRISIEDNFFEIGGHSLLATQVISRVRRRLNIDVPLRVLFETPTITALAEAVTQMLRGSQTLKAASITPSPRNVALPLSFGQQRLWVASQLEPNSCRYSVPRAIRLKGVLNPQAVETALNDVVARHEVLRTTYAAERGCPLQIVTPNVVIGLPFDDLSLFPAAVREQEASRILQEEAAKPFDLERDIVLRARLLRLDSEDHILFLNTHHIASDGWSFGILQRDFIGFYRASIGSAFTPAPELSIQYADYAVWQRKWLRGELLEKQLAYWRTRLDGAPPLLAIPTDRPRPKVQSYRGSALQMLLPRSLAEAIHVLSRQERITVFMTMLAAFQCLVMRRSGVTDLVIGTDVAGRNDTRTEDLIGFFVNLLPLRTDLSGDPSFQECLSRVHETALGAYSHQDVPFDRVVEELRPKRNRAYSPLVQVLFSQRDTPRNHSSMPGIEMSGFDLTCNSIFDLNVSFADRADGIALAWVYNSDLFDEGTVANLADLYKFILERVSANPGIRLSEIGTLLTSSGEAASATSLHAASAIG